MNDPFGTLRACRASSVPKSLRSARDEVFQPMGEVQEVTSRIDYRGLPGEGRGQEDNLAVTEELLELLEDFKKKSYTVKEMEILFENWRRKAAIPENYKETEQLIRGKDDKSSKSGAYSLLRMFRGTMTAENKSVAGIKKTCNAKKFLKPSSPELSAAPGQPPPPLDEDTMGLVVELPPTPLKPESPPLPAASISSQILPLSRLSGSSSSLQRHRPVAEVSPFTDTIQPEGQYIQPDRHLVSPEERGAKVLERLQRLRRSITEPLMQNFHDMHMTSPDTEEPDVLNTPKSLISTPLTGVEEGERRLSRRLFSSSSSTSREEPKRHKARTSQVHEYQNISPTPNTDL